MTVHSLEFGSDYDGNVHAECTGCRWDFSACHEARDAHYEFARHLAELFHPESNS